MEAAASLVDSSLSRLGMRPFDADNHYWEPADCFTRHLDPAFTVRGVRASRLGERVAFTIRGEAVPEPLGLDEVPTPGALRDFFMGNPLQKDAYELMGSESPADHPEYYDRDVRLEFMDRQGLDGAWMFPSFGVTFEELLQPDVEASLASHRAFNRWLDEDWGLAYKDRIFAAAYLVLSDVAWAVEELEWALQRGARVVCIRPGPVYTADGTRSPADPMFDPFWARVQEAGIAVALHFTIRDGYGFINDLWEPPGVGLQYSPLRLVTVHNRAISDFLAAVVCHRLFERFPRLRIASIENGSSWVPDLIDRLERADMCSPGWFSTPAARQFRDHVWVSPFYEDDFDVLARLMPANRILFGSDWPHPEGMAEPLDYLARLDDFDERDVRRIMHDNAVELNRPPS